MGELREEERDAERVRPRGNRIVGGREDQGNGGNWKERWESH